MGHGEKGDFAKSWPVRAAAVALAVSFVLVGALAGRAARREGARVELSSSAVLMQGYKQTVTVNATPGELAEFFSKPDNLFFPNTKIKETVYAEGQSEFGPGSSFNFIYAGVVPSRMIAIKFNEGGIWYMRDQVEFQILQWDFVRAQDGTRLTYRTFANVPDIWWIQAGSKVLTPDFWNRSNDRMMANIQATFDSSLDPDDLVSHGLRGEAYKSLLQVHQAVIHSDASLERAKEVAADPGLLAPLIGTSDDGCMSESFPDDRALHCSSAGESTGQPIVIENFCIEHHSGAAVQRRIYQVALTLVGFLEITVKPEKGGSGIELKWSWQMPDSQEPAGLDQALLISTFPDRMEKAADNIKHALEAGP